MTIPRITQYSSHTYPLFPLGIGFDAGIEAYHWIKTIGMHGDFLGYIHDAGVLGEVIARAGDGDHLEIGTMWGGSAIIAMKVKSILGLAGNIVCIDPLDGYYTGQPFGHTLPRMLEWVQSNFKCSGFEDRFEIIAKKSKPWPIYPSRQFVSAFIDGDHSYDGVWHDWECARKYVSKYILFDNYDATHADSGIHQDVVRAANRAMHNEEWYPVYIAGISLVMAHKSLITQGSKFSA